MDLPATRKPKAKSSGSIKPKSFGWPDNPKRGTYKSSTTSSRSSKEIYNEHRPHRALKRATPGHSYRATPKAAPTGTGGQQHFRARMDKIDETGKVSLRYAGKLRHLGIGRVYKHEKVRILTADTDAIVIHHDTGEILAEFTLDPSRDYQPKKKHPDPKTGA